jgi:hypothetical protein
MAASLTAQAATGGHCTSARTSLDRSRTARIELIREGGAERNMGVEPAPSALGKKQSQPHTDVIA